MTCWTSTKEETVEQQQKLWHDLMSARQGSAQRHGDQDLDIKHQEGETEAYRSSSQSMKSFFEREHKRYETRKQNTKKKQDKIDLYRQMIRELVQANLSFAAKCKKNKILTEQIMKANSWR
jgi:hypothetical protein